MRLIIFIMATLLIVNGGVAQVTSPKYLGEGNEHNCFIITEEGDYWFNVAHLNNPKNAFVLWNENGEMDITNVRLYESQLHFTKNKYIKGNASITVTNDDGEILWTWWIWSTDQPEYYEKNGVWMMDRNLGATTTELSSPESYGLSFNPGNPFPFPGAKYNNFEITDSPSVPEGWYVADGYGFYRSHNKPSPQTSMMLCTDKNKYGNSVYYNDWLNPCPDNAYTPYWYDFINFIGDEPTVTPEALVGKEGYTIPCIYYTNIEQGEGRYLCRGQYNQTAVDTYVVYFYNEMAKYSYCQGADRLPIRAFSNMPPVGSLYHAYVEVDGKGNVYVNGIDRTNSSFSINSEEIQEIYFSPNYGYEMESVEVNGVDKTSELKDNLLTLQNVTGAIIIKAKFSALTVNLSFSSGEGGSVFIRSQFGEPQTIGFTIEDGWDIYGVYMNGMDVTQNLTADLQFTTPPLYDTANIKVIYKNRVDSSIESVKANHGTSLHMVDSGECYINTPQATTATLYSLDGNIIRTCPLTAGDNYIPIPDNKILIIIVGEDKFKICN